MSAWGLSGVDVGLGEAGGADGEGIVGLDQLDQLARVLEAAVGLDPVLLAGRRIAAQRKHVVDARGVISSSVARSSGDGGADAGEVGHRLQAVLVLDALDDLDGLCAGGAAGAVGDRDERGLERAQLGRARRTGSRSPWSVLGGKNSKEKTGSSPASSSSIRIAEA